MSGKRGIDWERIFREKAEAIDPRLGVTEDPVREGVISFQGGVKCNTCGHEGIFSGRGIFSGNIFDAIYADYCPECKSVRRIQTVEPMITSNPEGFLGTIQQRLVDFPELISQTGKGADLCPECGSPTRTVEVNKGRLNTSAHRWTVCASGCGWKGRHETLP